MSQKELQRVKVIENAAGGRLSVREASRLLHLSERQVRRLKRRYQPDSIDWVHHGNLGRSMPWAASSPQKQLILTLTRGKYVGFNDSHLTEKLCDEENLAVSRETARRILRGAKLASPQKRRLPRRRKEKLRCPASITSPAAHFGSRYLNDNGGDKVSLQLIGHFLVATTGSGHTRHTRAHAAGTRRRVHGQSFHTGKIRSGGRRDQYPSRCSG